MSCVPWKNDEEKLNWYIERSNQDSARAARLERDIAKKIAEVEKLRTLIKELADVVEGTLCDFECETKGTCTTDLDDTDPIVDCPAFRKRDLVAKARKEVPNDRRE